MTLRRKNGIFILGAGFSRPAGMPLGNEIWPEVLERARRLDGRAARFNDDLDAYIKFLHDCLGKKTTPEAVNFEEFIGFLDIEHFLGLRGSRTWSNAGNEGQIVVKTLIGQILAECTPPRDKIPKLYLDFAERLEPGDLIITFNYDVILERALENVGKPFRLFGRRYSELDGMGGGYLTDEDEEVIVLKMHGSIDWFDKSHYLARAVVRKAGGSRTLPGDIIFNSAEDFGIKPILDGPRYNDDPFINMFRVDRIEDLYRRDLLFHETPWLLSPSTNKILHAEPLTHDHWRGLGYDGEMSGGMAIIGYSLPDHDQYARQAIYTLVKNYQDLYWHGEIPSLGKTPLVIIDHRQTAKEEADLKNRYRFLDNTKTQLYVAGFNEASLDKIFTTPVGRLTPSLFHLAQRI